MTTNTGYLAIAVWKHSDGNVSDMTVGFADTEDAALAQGKAYDDENTLPEHTSELMSLTAHHVREIGSNDRWSYADDDVVWTGAEGSRGSPASSRVQQLGEVFPTAGNILALFLHKQAGRNGGRHLLPASFRVPI